VASAVARENLRILEEENILDHVRQVAAPALEAGLRSLTDHPMVGELAIKGMMASLPLTPDKTTRAAFAAEKGTVGLICRERCFANNLVMRHVGDRMIISPPLVITPEEIDVLVSRARKAFDEAYREVRSQGLLEAAA
jgi:putrescine aminotransferase